MTTPELFLRALPERFDLVEAYSYRFDLSNAASFAPVGPPNGRIRAVYPYRVGTWPSVGGPDHGSNQPSTGRPPAESGEGTATVGHLLFADLGRTNLEDTVLSVQGFATLPLQVPMWAEAVDSVTGVDLRQRSAAVLEAGYVPWPPETVPLSIEVDLMDRGVLAAEEVVEATRGQTVTSEALTRGLERPGVDARGLVLVVRVVMTLENSAGVEPEKLAPPVLTRAALTWPTIPWSESLRLFDGRRGGSAFQYRPDRREVEWTPRFEMRRVPSARGDAPDSPVRWHRTLCFTLDEVADVAEESHLCGRVEVEVADRLLSGLQVRHCDATGAPASTDPRRTSRILAEVRVSLREMLRRQTRSLLHRLSFTGVTFEDRRVADVRSTLTDCGLKVVPGPTVEGGGESTELVIAERPIGGETLRVMACLRGSRHEALRTTELAGGTSYRTKVESGDLEVILHGRFRGPDETLAEVLDGVHERLRAVFGATTDHR